MDGSGNNILNAYGRVLGNDNALFWSLQLFGWTGISLLTYLSLSVPYDQYELAYLAHNICWRLRNTTSICPDPLWLETKCRIWLPPSAPQYHIVST